MPNVIPESPKTDTLIISYLTLRKLVGLLSIGLIPIMVLGSFILDHTTKVQISVSAYYHTGMRDEYVGIICGIAFFLFSYNGYSRQDSIASKSAGFFALCIALLPTSATADKTDIISIIHYVTAGIFFAILAYMSIFLFTKSSGNMTPEKRKRNKVYIVCGIIMAVSVIGIPVSSIPAIKRSIGFLKPTLIFETFALTSFGLSWLTKGEFLLADKENK
jgi:hypothetical protein